jgi:adenosylcobinamide-phosphate synthase
MSGRRVATAAVTAGIAVDWLLGEPPAACHPVAAFGQAMLWLEDRWYADSRRRGLLHAASGTALAVAAGSVLSAALRGQRPADASPLLRPTTPALGSGAGRSSVAVGGVWGRPRPTTPALRSGVSRSAVVLAIATYVTVAGRALRATADQVAAALQAGDLDAARARLPALVGRDPAGLDACEVARAVVESLAENTVDAIVAPALWAALAGPAGALAYRALNTLDAMVGHPSPRYIRFGWASARADDVAGWLPARLTAALVAVVRPHAARAVIASVVHQAPAHPSPNAGVAEAAFAGALGVRLGGINVYGARREERAPLGWGAAPRPTDIARAVRLSRDVTAAAALLGLVLSGRWWRA